MTLIPVVTYGDPILGRPVALVPEVTEDLLRLTDDMFDTMQSARGVGLAANQVGVDLCLAVIAYQGERLKLFNPRVVERAGQQRYLEGCLSLPGIEGDVSRAESVLVTYLDSTGASVERRAKGHLARILQHEIDHLNGILMLNHLSVAARTLQRAALDRLREQYKKRGTRRR